MNTLFLRVSFNGRETISLPAKIVEVNKAIIVNQLQQDHPQTFFFKINHGQINTLLDLTNIAPYELWYFNEKKEFTGKSFSLQKGDAPFQIQTQARYIALVPYRLNYTQVVYSTKVTSRVFTLSVNYLPASDSFASEREQWALSLFNLTDIALIDTLNNEIGKNGWTQARSHYLDCLKKELSNRTFNSNILFEFDTNGAIVSFQLKEKVELINHTLKFITQN